MNPRSLLLLPLLCLPAGAVPLTLTNADFSASGANTNPTGWTTAEQLAGGVSVQVSTLPEFANVLTFQGRSGVNNVQQNLLTTEATADTYGSYTVSFDAGWRNNTAAPNDLGWTVSIVNVSDGDAILGSATYTLPPDLPSNQLDVYRHVGLQSLSITYDNTDPGLVGDTIALRIESNSSQNYFNPTGWIDNVTVENGTPDPVLTLGALPEVVSDGTTTTFSIGFTNDGETQDLILNDVTLDGPDAVDFTVTGFSTPVSPGGSGTIDISFTPMIGGGTYSLNVNIDSNSAISPLQIVPLTAQVRDPDASLSVSAVDFGTLATNPGPTTATVTITNDGATEDLDVISVSLVGTTGDFTVTSTPAGPIAPGASADVEVTFSPAAGAAGGFGDLLVIETDAAFDATRTLPVIANINPPGSLPVALGVVNGDFEANTYNSAQSTAPDGWTSSLAGAPGNYGQGDPNTPNLASIAAHFQARGGNYIQQDLSSGNSGLTADQITAIEVGLEKGYRNDASTNGDILIRLSLWDLVANAEIAAREFLILDGGVVAGAGANQLVSDSFVLPVSSVSTNPVALRITHQHPDATATFTATSIIDNVTLALSGSYVPSGTPFETWALANGLDGTPGKENGEDDDPDKDGASNFREFAFGADPLDPASRGLVAMSTADTDSDSQPELLLTLAVRAGGTWSGSPSVTATVDGVVYAVEGSTTLAVFDAGVEGPLGTASVPPSLPASAPSGYEYLTFRLGGSNGLPGNGFLRASSVSE